METQTDSHPVLRTTVGEFPLHRCRLSVGGREWSVLHTGATISHADESEFLDNSSSRLPYGVVLWPSAIALAHEVATREKDFRGRTVLELGAGTGLPGIIAASLGARVVQTDRQELALYLCRLNGERNGALGIQHREADWTVWPIEDHFDWILGSDVLYGETLHPHLRRIIESNLKPGGRVLLADPFRAASVPFLESLEADGWRVVMSKWSVGDNISPRAIGVYELTPPTNGCGTDLCCSRMRSVVPDRLGPTKLKLDTRELPTRQVD